MPRSSDGCLALANSDLAKLKEFVVMGESQILIVPKIWWLDLEEWLIQDRMIRDVFSDVYVTTKDGLPKNAEKNLIAYMRVDPSRPSVAVIKSKPPVENIGLRMKMGLSLICMKVKRLMDKETVKNLKGMLNDLISRSDGLRRYL